MFLVFALTPVTLEKLSQMLHSKTDDSLPAYNIYSEFIVQPRVQTVIIHTKKNNSFP